MLPQVCTSLYFTKSRHKYVQISLSLQAGKRMYSKISLSPEAGTNMLRSLSPGKLVQVCTVQISLSPKAGTNKYKSLSHREPAPICTILGVCVCDPPERRQLTAPAEGGKGRGGVGSTRPAVETILRQPDTIAYVVYSIYNIVTLRLKYTHNSVCREQSRTDFPMFV